MRLLFYGGVDTVTGSQHILEANGHRILRDCGMFQGSRKESAEKNSHLPFDAKKIHNMVLSHAHIDHCGNLPTLVKNGFNGTIYTTSATAELCRIMLRDSAKIQEQDAAYLNQKTSRRGMEPVIPLYTMEEAEKVFPLIEGYQYGDCVEVAPGVQVSFVEAGHILGSALTVFDVEENGRKVRVGFAFDLGRKNLPLIRDPDYLERIDVLVLESTYGDRLHDEATEARKQLGDAVRRTYERKGKVIIPSFALERAQEIIFHLSSLMSTHELPRIPVYVDSPMAAAVTQIFELNYDYLDEEARMLNNVIGSAVNPPWVHFVSSVEESKSITESTKPCIVVSASGMCENGRILHHLKHGITNPLNTILIVGFQAVHTLGRRLVDQETQVKIFGDVFERKAEVVALNAFSAHADRNDLLEYVRRVKPAKTFLVHGEADQRQAFAQTLRAENLGEVFTPSQGQAVEL